MNGFRAVNLLLLGTATALTMAGGLLQGLHSSRWATSQALPRAGELLSQFAAEIPGWEEVARRPLSPSAVEILQCGGYLNRVYRHRETGQMVNVAVVVGPPGPTSVHTPEICYTSRDYDIQSRRESFRIDQDEFWGVTFRSLKPGVGVMQVAYAWSDGQGWQAPDSPRLRLRYIPVLYKIQLAARLPAGVETTRFDSCQAFLQDFLPVFHATIHAEEEGA